VVKVYIFTDMEGISGITTNAIWDQKSDAYRAGRTLLTKEVNAAVEGALEGGATTVVVNDGHDGHNNIIVEDLHPEAEYETGECSLDETYDAAFLIGYHAMAGTEKAFLDHTQGPRWHNYFLNGIRVGEIGQCAAIAGHYGVPVVLVTGDAAACKEAKELLGDEIETVVVKYALNRFSARSIHPRKARRLIREAAKRALAKAHEIKPFKLKTPIEVKVEWATTDIADSLERREGVRRIDARTIVKIVPTALEILNF